MSAEDETITHAGTPAETEHAGTESSDTKSSSVPELSPVIHRNDWEAGTYPLSEAELEDYLSQLIDTQALELCPAPDGSMLIPFAMNDSMEHYLELTSCRTQGKWLSDFDGAVSLKVELNDTPIDNQVPVADTKADASPSAFNDTPPGRLVLRQGGNAPVELYFSRAFLHRTYYQYHLIGHLWHPGDEHWRRMVNASAVIYDKACYISPAACNEYEQKLLLLMEFAPFRMWEPIRDWHIASLYQDSESACLLCEDSLKDLGHKKLAAEIALYRKMRYPAHLAKHIHEQLNLDRYADFYELIYDWFVKASLAYPARSYGPDINARIAAARQAAIHKFHALGFQGDYPLFQKTGLQVLAIEEHPFTVMEWDDFHFEIHYLISNVPGAASCRLCQGFFRAKDHQCLAAEHLEEAIHFIKSCSRQRSNP